MGTELVGDFWLSLLIVPGKCSCAPAKKLLRAQILTQNRTGHLLALGEELPRKRITQAAKKGGIPEIYVRCWRCGAAAWLMDWIEAAELSWGPRNERIAKLKAEVTGDRTLFLQRCDGTSYLDAMEALSSDPGDGVLPCK